MKSKISSFTCPHCRAKIRFTKPIRKAAMRAVASQPRPGARGQDRVEICRKAAAASVLKRWGYVRKPGDPTFKERKAMAKAALATAVVEQIVDGKVDRLVAESGGGQAKGAAEISPLAEKENIVGDQSGIAESGGGKKKSLT